VREFEGWVMCLCRHHRGRTTVWASLALYIQGQEGVEVWIGPIVVVVPCPIGRRGRVWPSDLNQKTPVGSLWVTQVVQVGETHTKQGELSHGPPQLTTPSALLPSVVVGVKGRLLWGSTPLGALTQRDTFNK
jgi:hypothetical protein